LFARWLLGCGFVPGRLAADNPVMGRIGLLSLLLVALLASQTACTFKGEQVQAKRNGAAAQAWWPWPTGVRVHPATRFAMHNHEPVLEARIELLDALLDATKGSGTFRLELLDAAGPMNAPRSARQLYVWDLALMTLEDQQQHYDPVTRSYYFPLKLDDFEVAQRPTRLRVTFTPAGEGERVAAVHALRP
jgi:hypothetical protein